MVKDKDISVFTVSMEGDYPYKNPLAYTNFNPMSNLAKREMDNNRKDELKHEMKQRLDTCKVKIDVRGSVFVTAANTINKIPGTKLSCMLRTKEYWDKDAGSYFFDRNPDVFNSVLDGYSKGKFHIPSHMCVTDFLEELDFWDIPHSMIAKCCTGLVWDSNKEKKASEAVQKELLSGLEYYRKAIDVTTGWRAYALRMWLFLDDPNYSKGSKAFSFFIALIVILQILLITLTTNVMILETLNLPVNGTKYLRLRSRYEDIATRIPAIALNAILTIEIVVRFVVCPEKRNFLKSLLNWVDIVATISSWNSLLIFSGRGPLEYTSGTDLYVVLVIMLPTLRVFSILRLARCFTGTRIVLLVLRRSLPELVTLIAFLSVGMVIYAFLFYLAELKFEGSDITDIPRGIWLAIITMTTVGYGDIRPVTFPGCIVGGMCAVTGIVLTGLAIPIISGNFNLYYRDVNHCLQKQKESAQESSSTSKS
ncbi:potassium voltage-gated channel subfamily C member 3-like [Lineus longissimus]|uniref:potassium voltage-gated channel subfamily C member 3-like n=1 Tax=Lineus longissimus TaxID=88925 RepID=UPI00315D7144